MKYFFVIFQLISLCVYTFTHKTHWCYHTHTHERFHGDCQWKIKSLHQHKDHSQQHLIPKRYYCLDAQKDVILKEESFLFSSSGFDLDIAPLYCFSLIFILNNGVFFDGKITDAPIRAGPDLLANSLRGPPLV